MPPVLTARQNPPREPQRTPLVPLGRLRPGQSAVIGRIEGRWEDVHRLEEFGLRSGTAVEMFRTGNPCILRLAGNKVCLRMHRTLAVLVAPLPT
jgi:ferrous iron transport protein A